MTQPAKVREFASSRGWGLRLGERTTPERIGLLQARLLKICGDLARVAPPYGLDHGEEGYEACWQAPMELPVPEGLDETSFPGGWHMVATHSGSYDALGDTLENILTQWLPHSGFRKREGPLMYRYLTDPREAQEADLRTEICVPVQPDPIE